MGYRKWLLVFGLMFGMQAHAAYPDDFRILTHNVFMLSQLISNSGQMTRAPLLANADYLNGYDAVIFNELFDNAASQAVLSGLANRYPYQTPVLGRSRAGWDATLGAYSDATIEDGGVAIVSPWPIVEKIQYIFQQGCGADGFSNKGFVYVKIDKQGHYYHVIGTHVQADDGSCSVAPAYVRARQFDEIKNFIAAHQIPADQVIFIGGDMNVIKGTAEYQSMLQHLHVNEPDVYAGVEASWDPTTNGVNKSFYPAYNEGQQLDYILVAADHAQPSHWQNLTMDVTAPRWQIGNYQYQDYSDHYPLAAFAYANDATPTHSFKPVNQPYNHISLRNQGNGKYVQVDANDSDGWIRVDADSPGATTSFVLDNWYPGGNAFCIRNGDFVRLESNYHQGGYWNWWLGGGGGNYAYYTKSQDPSNKLRLGIVNDSGACLKDDDQVYFYDRDTLNGRDYFLTRWASGAWRDHLYLWSGQRGANETFTVSMPTAQYQSWGSSLIYQP